jgi:hypothetical protein
MSSRATGVGVGMGAQPVTNQATATHAIPINTVRWRVRPVCPITPARAPSRIPRRCGWRRSAG